MSADTSFDSPAPLPSDSQQISRLRARAAEILNNPEISGGEDAPLPGEVRDLLEQLAALEIGEKDATPYQFSALGPDTPPFIQLHPQDNRFRVIFEKAPLGMSLVDDSNRVLEVNKHLLEMFGYQRHEYVGCDSFNFIHPDFAQMKREKVARLMGGEISSYELVEKRLQKDGSPIWIRVTSTRIWDPLKQQFVRLNMVEDINEKKAARDAVQAVQRKLQEIASAMPGGVYECYRDPKGNAELQYANEGFGIIFQTPTKNLLGPLEKLENHIHPEDLPDFRASMSNSASFLTPWKVEFRITCSGKRQKWVRAEATPSRQPDRAIVWHGLMTDITGQKQIQDELRQAKETAELATRTKSEFLTNISHEIRTPMNAVLGFSELLDRELKDPIHRQYLQSIRSAGGTLLHLINDFLDLSRIEAGKITLQSEPLRLAAVLDDIRRLFLLKVHQKGLEFWIHLDPRLPDYILSDDTRLRQILFNLVGNAVKFTRQGYVGLKVRRTAVRQEGAKIDLEIQVEDTGVGIKPEETERIFESFEQQRDQNREYGGTGLGLAITRRIVEAMGGKISVESAPDQGSTFVVQLRHVPVVLGEAEERVRTFEHQGPPRFRDTQVLVLDDKEDDRSLIQGFLGDTGAEVREAINYEEALRALRSRLPEVFFMDLRIPLIDDLEFVRSLRNSEQFAGLKIVLLTAQPQAVSQRELQELKIDYLLIKPTSRGEFLNTLLALLPEDKIETPPDETDSVAEQETDPEDWRTVAHQQTQAPWPHAVLEVLAEIRRDRLPELSTTPDIDLIQALADELEVLARQHNLPVLKTYAAQLNSAVDIFDVSTISRLLEEFPELIDQVNGAA